MKSPQPSNFQICVQGTLPPRWSDWFDGFKITPIEPDQTVLSGLVRDQSALYGLLAKIRDLNLELVWLRKIPPV